MRRAGAVLGHVTCERKLLSLLVLGELSLGCAARGPWGWRAQQVHSSVVQRVQVHLCNLWRGSERWQGQV